jgi:LysR family hydrogen peroxide-inducible transcriptional activator
MVAAGVGVTLLPELAVHAPIPASPDVSLVRFTDPAPRRQIAMLWRETSGYRELLPRLADEIRQATDALVDLTGRGVSAA